MKAKWQMYNAICRAIQGYAAQIWGSEMFREVDKLQCFFFKRIYRLPNCTPTYAIMLKSDMENGHLYTLNLHLRRERKEVEKTGMPSTWERYDEMEDILRRYESHGQHEQDDDKTNIKKENDWKKNRRKISQNDSDLHQNDSDDQSEFDDISQSGGEDVSTTNTSLVSMPKKTTCTKNPLADKNRSTKKIKLSQPSPIMEIDKNDDIDLFFLSMAKTVKKLKLHEQIKLKQNICNLVFDAELNSVQSDKPNANNILDLDSNS
ncbi:uncharacterized protein [Eurosta solidaginis]|uniref:uncharacterized protein isoform X4 n=1 Tax=Eurosta solidaginis TaxID=178769 RepID=UPI003530FC75